MKYYTKEAVQNYTEYLLNNDFNIIWQDESVTILHKKNYTYNAIYKHYDLRNGFYYSIRHFNKLPNKYRSVSDKLPTKKEEMIARQNAKDIFVFANPHPQQKRVGDCFKRAITLAENRDYRDVSLELNRLKNIIGTSSYNSDYNIETYCRKYTKINIKPMTCETFCRTYKSGVYVIMSEGHVMCIKDGKVYDTWNSTQERIIDAYKVG